MLSTASGFAFGRMGTTGQVGFEFLASGSKGNAFATTSTVIDNTWHHVVVIKQGNQAFIYADGVLENSETVSTASQNNALPLLIGYNPGEGTRGHWKGQLDEIAIYSRALGAAEVGGLFLAGVMPAITQTGGTIELAGGTLWPTAGAVTVLGGALKGTGTVQGSVTNSATVAPGNSPGVLDITGNSTQTAAGLLDLEVAGRGYRVCPAPC